MSEQDLRAQAALQRQILQNLGSINTALSQQLTIQQLVRDESISGARAAQVTQERLTAAGVTATATSQALGGVGGAATNAAGMIRNDFAQSTGLATAAVSGLDNAASSVNNTLQFFHDFARSSLHNSLAQLQKDFGGLMGPGGVTDSSERQSNRLVANLRDINDEVYRQLRSTDQFRIAIGEGAQGVALQDIFGANLANTMEAFNSLAADSINMMAVMRDGSSNLAIEMALLGKGLGYTAEETSVFVQRQISLTGEANTDLLQQAAAVAKDVERVTGISSKRIGKYIAGMTADTKNFGNVTQTEMGRISATLFELGIDYEDLGNMVGKFQGFDSAAQSVSALTTVFGVQLDAMDMMRAANESQEEFLHRMRDAFLAAGRSADTMSLAEKRLVQEQLNLKDVESVERLFDPTKSITSMQDLATATKDVPADVQQVLDELSSDIVDFGKLTDFQTNRTKQFILDGIKAPLELSAISAEQDLVRVGRALRGALGAAIGTGDEAAIARFAEALGNLAGTDVAKLGDVNEKISQIATNLSGVNGEITAEGFTDTLGEVAESLGSLDIGSKLTDGVTEATSKIEEAFESMAANIVQTLKDHELIRDDSPHTWAETSALQGAAAYALMSNQMVGSVSQAGTDINLIQEENAEAARRNYLTTAESVSDAFHTTFGAMTAEGTEAFNKISAISNDSLTTQLQDASSVYSRMANEMGFLGVTYDRMTEEQKEFLKTNLKLGEDYEEQIRAIMNSEEAQRGRRERSQGTFITDMLKSYRSLGEAEQARLLGNEDFMKSLKDNYNIDADTFRAAMSGESGDIESLVRSRLEERERRRIAESATEASRSSSEQSEEEARTSRGSRAQTRELRSLNENVIQNTRELGRIKAAIETMSRKIQPMGRVVLRIGERDIADAVISSPAGSEETEGAVVIQR